jgi:hypothetical protein
MMICLMRVTQSFHLSPEQNEAQHSHLLAQHLHSSQQHGQQSHLLQQHGQQSQQPSPIQSEPPW